MDLVLRKMPGYFLAPADEKTVENLQKLKVGQIIHGQFKRLRNPKFHQKFMALVRFLFDQWAPGEFQDPCWKGVAPEKSFERFRKDLIILAGHYDASYRLDGSVRIEAKSVSFSNMDEEEFENLYSNIINVGLQRVLPHGYNSEKVRSVIDQLLAFS